MAYVKMRGWQLFLISALVIPILDRLATQLEKNAPTTPEQWDDIAAGALRVVVDLLKNGKLFEET